MDLTTEQELEKLNNYLDDFETKLGFPNSINENTVNRATALMNIDFNSYKPTQEECQEHAAILSQYLLNLSRVISREESIIHWAKEKIKKLVVPNLKRQTAYNWDERLAGAVADNETATRLNEIKIKSELHLIRIKNNYFSIKEIAAKLSDLGKALRGIR